MRDKSMSSQRVSNAPTRDVNAVQRVELAVKLRSTKMSYDAIAKQCGYGSASACRKAVMRELDRCVVKAVEALRTEEADSLERLEQECWKIFYDKERQKGQLFAVDRILAIKERRARLLGLDTPIDAALAMNQIIVRETPQGWITQPAVEATTV